ncbi:MAG: hypothetical protein V4649_19940 [Bacteroidota bacterium]
MVNAELILDLGKLYKKHGPNSFGDLADFLKDPSHIDSLILILESSSKFKKDISSTKIKQKKPANLVPKGLENLSHTDLPKFEILNQFYQQLVAREFLTSVREINFFREDNGLSVSKAKSHKEAISALINELANASVEKLKKLEVKSSNEGNGLQGWSDIILNRK